MTKNNQRSELIIKLLALTVFLLFPLFARPQTQQPPQPTMTDRQQAILEHEKRIQAILDQRRKEREAERQRQLEEKQRQEVIEKERARRATAPTRPVAPGAAKPGAAPQFARTGLSTVVLYVDPMDSAVKEGDQFATDIRVYTDGTFICDSLGIALTYDRAYIEPLRVYDFALRPLLSRQPDFSVDNSIGSIFYSAQFKKPEELGKEPLLTILWKARASTDFTNIRFAFGSNGTHLDLKGTDLLGTTLNSEDGTISASVAILPKSQIRGKILPPVSSLALSASQDWDYMLGKVNLQLLGPQRQIKTGETFFVDVLLSNPYLILCDNVSLWIRFDPEKLDVLDYDSRNWISLGTNILDGFAHGSYPFNYHKTNEANNARGEILYDMGISTPTPLPSGTFARIKFRAKAPAQATDIWLARSPSNSFPTSDVTYLGQSLLPADEKKHYASAIAVHISQQR